MSRLLMDHFWRLVYRLAYPLMWLYWRVRQPEVAGAAVLVRTPGKLLLIRHSYKPRLGVPAGLVRSGEDPREAAVRETEEEVGIALEAEELRALGEVRGEHHASRRAVTYYYEAELSEEPAVTIDRREIVWGEFVAVERLADLRLSRQLEAVLAGRLVRRQAHSS